MCVVDARTCYSKATKVEETQEAYYLKLSEEMIDNLLDANTASRIRKIIDKTLGFTTTPNPLISDNGRQKDNTGIHVTSIRRSNGGKNSSHTTQQRCRKCIRKTKNQCGKCEPTYAIFSGRNGRDFFVKHYEEEQD